MIADYQQQLTKSQKNSHRSDCLVVGLAGFEPAYNINAAISALTAYICTQNTLVVPKMVPFSSKNTFLHII